MSDLLKVSVEGLSSAGTQIRSSSETASLATAALAGVQAVVSVALVGNGIAYAAAEFSSGLAARCHRLSGSVEGHGSTITQASQVYAEVESFIS